MKSVANQKRGPKQSKFSQSIHKILEELKVGDEIVFNFKNMKEQITAHNRAKFLGIEIYTRQHPIRKTEYLLGRTK